MLEMALNEGVSIHKRNIEYCDEISRSFNDVVVNIVESLDCTNVMWAPCVCPLVKNSTYIDAINFYFKNCIQSNTYTSVVSVKKFKEYLYCDNGPVNFSPKNHVPSQNLPEWSIIINGFFISPKDIMLSERYLYGKNTFLYLIPKYEDIDIDDKYGYDFAKSIYMAKNNK